MGSASDWNCLSCHIPTHAQDWEPGRRERWLPLSFDEDDEHFYMYTQQYIVTSVQPECVQVYYTCSTPHQPRGEWASQLGPRIGLSPADHTNVFLNQ